LGDHLRKKRLDQKLHQMEVARRLGTHKTTIYNWEKNRATPSLPFLPKIVEVLGYIPHDSTSDRSIGQRIADSRRLLGMTQKELARRLGIDPSTLARWERGERQPSKALLEKLTVFLTEPAG
jgi:transcriptional regulator with XRE-family HTH domain